MKRRHVVVVGGGFSGVLLSIHLLERGAWVTLIERADRLARGVAYSTAHPDHLLNVRASGMSAFPDRPDHFANWLQGEVEGEAQSFARRRTYGAYVGSLLDDARVQAVERMAIVRAEVLNVTPGETGEIVQLAGGARIEADAVVLALGNLPSEMPRVIAAAGLPDGVYEDDPWSPSVAVGLGPDDGVLLIGTGLTAIDAALLLDSAGFSGRILALSRRGLLPRAHADAPFTVPVLDAEPEPRCTALARLVRVRAEQLGWRAAVDSLRPVTQSLWARASVAERRRFLRHLRPWWDVHRHRIAPSIARRLDEMVAAGRLQLAAGRIVSVHAEGDAAALRWRARGEAGEQALTVRRIVNCTGPQADIARAREPVLDALIAAGRVRADACRIGIDVDAHCRAIGAAGEPSPSLLAVGPITKSAFWEVVAVPDIRSQVRDVAQTLAGQPGPR